MSIQIRCPNLSCGKAGRVPEESGGRVVRCRQCGHAFTVPADETLAPVGKATCKQTARATEGSVPPSLAPELSVQAARPAGGSIPVQIGRFVIRERLGSGAFGEVYRATDPQLQREVALKVPRAAVVEQPQVIERFLREGKAAAGLNHPHIVPVYDAGQDRGHYYLAAAFIAGQTLERAIEQHTLDFRRSAEVVRDLAEALAYAHRQGIVHRDVKPANVLLDEQGVAYVADFGLAYRQQVEDKLTHDGTILGTPAYMAPEHAEGQQSEPRPASDQYSLGVVLYELLCGQTPFGGPVPLVLFNAVNTRPEPPRKRNAEVPRDLETICLKAMAKQPKERYAGCQELAEDLRRWLDGEPIRAQRLSMAERLLRWCKREPRLAALAALTAVCLLVVSMLATVKTRALKESEEETGLLVGEARELAARARQSADAAGRQAGDADREAGRARQAERSAEEHREAARQANERKEKDKLAAVAARKKAETQEKQYRQLLYQSHLELARLAFEQGDLLRSRALLARHAPAPGHEDFRDQTWHALWGRLRETARTVLSHPRAVTCVAFSPAGSRLATGCEDGTIRLWDVSTGQEVLTLKGHTGWVSGVCFGPGDDTRLASSSWDGTVRVWDVSKGREVSTFKPHTGRVRGVCFNRDGKLLASAGDDNTVRVWEARTGRETQALKGHTDVVSGVCFSPNGRVIVSASHDGTVRLWDARTGQLERICRGHAGAVTGVCFSPAGRHIASSDQDRTVRVWDPRTGKEHLTLKDHDGAVTGVCFSPDGERLASASTDGTVRVWGLWGARTGQLTSSPFETRSLSGKGLDELPEYSGFQREFGLDLKFSDHAGAIHAVSFGPRGDSLASASNDRTARIVDPRREIPLKGRTGFVRSVCFSPDGKRIASGSYDQTVKVWDTRTGQEILSLKGHTDSVHSVCFSPDGQRLASASGDGTVKVWEAQTGQEVLSLKGHTKWVTSVCFSPDGQRIASGSDDKTVKVWDAQTGLEVLSLKGHTSSVTSVCFSPDGKRIASGSDDKTVRVWAADTRRQKALILQGHTGEVNSVCFSPDGQRIASASQDKTVKVWDAGSGQEIRSFKGHASLVSSVAFSPDSKRLASGSLDPHSEKPGEVKVWDTLTGRVALTLKGHTGTSVCFSPDGKRIASGGLGVKVWQLCLPTQGPPKAGKP